MRSLEKVVASFLSPTASHLSSHLSSRVLRSCRRVARFHRIMTTPSFEPEDGTNLYALDALSRATVVGTIGKAPVAPLGVDEKDDDRDPRGLLVGREVNVLYAERNGKGCAYCKGNVLSWRNHGILGTVYTVKFDDGDQREATYEELLFFLRDGDLVPHGVKAAFERAKSS